MAEKVNLELLVEVIRQGTRMVITLHLIIISVCRTRLFCLSPVFHSGRGQVRGVVVGTDVRGIIFSIAGNATGFSSTTFRLTDGNECTFVGSFVVCVRV